jgi:DNA-binding response OmpR family regulator
MSTPKGRILCTEDDQDTRDLLILVLNINGFEAVCASNAHEAIELARSEHFDLYLVDSWMPGTSGAALTARLREFDSRTPVLFYSGAGTKADKDAARASGAQGYLVKPVEGDQLIAEVTRLIAKSQIAAVQQH